MERITEKCTSTCRAARVFPSSDEPACTMTGYPWGARHVQRVAYLEVFPCMINAMDALWIGEQARVSIKQNSVILDAIPQGLDDIEVFCGALIAVAMVDVAVETEVHRLFRHR